MGSKEVGRKGGQGGGGLRGQGTGWVLRIPLIEMRIPMRPHAVR